MYAILADYHTGHPAILPPDVFRDLRVEEGGRGAGTRISFEMRSFGTWRRHHGVVSEPEPGRRLVETYPGVGIDTTFTVEPAEGGAASRVTIATTYARAGLRGRIERLLAPPFLRKVYAAELEQLAAVLAERRV